MTKREVLATIDQLLVQEQARLEEYRKLKGPESWGECPSDSIAAHKVGRIGAMQDLRRAVAKRRG